jgi:hypothetical protein
MGSVQSQVPAADLQFANPVRLQAKILWCGALLCAAGAAESYELGMTTGVALFATFGGLAGFVALIGTLWSGRVKSHLTELEAGNYYTCWTYSPEDSHEFTEGESEKQHKDRFPAATVAFGLFAALLGGIAWSAGAKLLDSGFLLFLACCIVGAAVGYPIDSLCDFVARKWLR